MAELKSRMFDLHRNFCLHYAEGLSCRPSHLWTKPTPFKVEVSLSLSLSLPPSPSLSL